MIPSAVSIIIFPSDAQSKELTLSSINEQAFDNYEVIYASELANSECCSVGKKYNTAISSATGEYVYIILEGDVFFDQYALEHIYARAQNDTCDILLCNQGNFFKNLSHSPKQKTFFSFADKGPAKLSQVPEVMATLMPWNKLFRRQLLQEKDLHFKENSSVPEILFTYSCYQRAAHISISDRTTYCHQRGYQGRRISWQTAHDTTEALQQILLSLNRSGDEKLKRAAFDKALHYCSHAFLSDYIIDMTDEEHHALLRGRGKLLQNIPRRIVEAYTECENTAFLLALYDEKYHDALELLHGPAVKQFLGKSLLSEEFRNAPTTCDPAVLRNAYARYSPLVDGYLSKINVTQRQRMPMSRLEKARIHLIWGNGERIEILDPASATIMRSEDIAKGSTALPAIMRRFSGKGEAEPTVHKLPSPHLKVLMLCAGAHHGEGYVSYRLVNSLRALGVDARLLSLDSTHKDSHVGRLEPVFKGTPCLRGIQANEQWRQRSYLSFSNQESFKGHDLFTSNLSAVDFRELTPLFAWADLIHLHWLDGVMDYTNFSEAVGNKPVVWTMSGMAPFTGGCHYSEGCEQYTSECERCPQFSGADAFLPHQSWREKEKAYRSCNMHIVAPSPGTASLARRSALFRDKPIHFIPNAHSAEHLIPLGRRLAREYFDLPKDKKIILLDAVSLRLPRKGGALLQDALRLFREQCANPDEILILAFESGAIETDFAVVNLGFVPQNFLPLAYSAADVCLLPSLEDNAPLMAGEALLCGTPVVGFSSTSLLAAIGIHKQNVYIAKNFDIPDFASGIAWGLQAKRTEEERLFIRETALRQCGSQVSARRYAKLYTAILGKKEDVVLPHSQDMGDADQLYRPITREDTKNFIINVAGRNPWEYHRLEHHWIERREGRERNAVLFSAKTDFNEFTYARQSHLEKLGRGYLLNQLHRGELLLRACDLKAYQHGLCAAFIDQMLLEKSKILEIGGGFSRVLQHYGHHMTHECWNLDKFEGLGNGPKVLPPNPRYKIVPAYIGEFASELPDEYFDLVFSASVLEHIPEDEALFKNILDDMQRVLKPGGHSMHCIDFGYKENAAYTMHGFIQYLFDNIQTFNAFVPLDAYPYKEEAYFMKKFQYDITWKSVLQMQYEDFGKPTSINIFWKKESRL